MDTISGSPHLQTPMDSIRHRKAKPISSSAAAHHHYSDPEPPIVSPSAIENISHRFSKLYSPNYHKKPTITKICSHPQPEIHFQEKVSPVLRTSCATLTKSKSHNERNDFAVSKVVVEVKEMIKKSSLIKKGYDEKSLESTTFEGGRRRSSFLPAAGGGDGDGGRRKSFCGCQIELSDFFSCNGVKTVAVDMPPFMQIHAVNCARKAHDSLEKFTSKTLAFTLKKEFDAAYGPAWHCIVGSSFGSFVTHSVGGFMYFSMDHKMHILLFKTTVQKADSSS